MLAEDVEPQLIRPPVAVRCSAAAGMWERALGYSLYGHRFQLMTRYYVALTLVADFRCLYNDTRARST